MFSALAKAFGQLSDPAFRRVLVRSVLAALGVFVAVWVAAWFGLSWAVHGERRRPARRAVVRLPGSFRFILSKRGFVDQQ